MNNEEIINFTNNLILKHTGKVLNNLQKAVLKGILEGWTYKEIKENEPEANPYDISYIAQYVAYELRKEITNALVKEKLIDGGERLNKKSLAYHLERSLEFFSEEMLPNILPVVEPDPKNPYLGYQQKILEYPRINLQEAPETVIFYGREIELATLKQWILQDNCRLVALLGIGGIGKTYLAAKLSREIANQFNYVIWQSLRNAPPLGELLSKLLLFLDDRIVSNIPENTSDRLLLLIEYIKSQPCLFILDSWETILCPGKPVGKYREGYEDYSDLINKITELSHQSCLIITSWETPQKLVNLANEQTSIRRLFLAGLESIAAQKILKDYQLSDEDKWEKHLLNNYQGHPLALKIVAGMIQEIFSGRVTEFLKEFTLYIDDELQSLLSQQLNRLSEVEIEIMYTLAIAKKHLTIGELRESLQAEILRSELFQSLQSLVRRSLVEKIDINSQTLFTLQPVVMKYVSKHYYLK